MASAAQRKKRRMMFRRKRTLDPNIAIDYKNPDVLKRFITDRGKIIPRRISGASAKQQREICTAVKRARYLALLPFSLAHRSERNFATEMAAVAASSMGSSRAAALKAAAKEAGRDSFKDNDNNEEASQD